MEMKMKDMEMKHAFFTPIISICYDQGVLFYPWLVITFKSKLERRKISTAPLLNSSFSTFSEKKISSCSNLEYILVLVQTCTMFSDI